MKKAFEGQRNCVPRDETNEASRSLPVCLRDLSSTLVCRCLVNAEWTSCFCSVSASIVSGWPRGTARTCARPLWLVVCGWSRSGWSRGRCRTGSCSDPGRTYCLWSWRASCAWNLDCSCRERREHVDEDGERGAFNKGRAAERGRLMGRGEENNLWLVVRQQHSGAVHWQTRHAWQWNVGLETGEL